MLVAVRDASGKLSSLPAHGAKYDLERWLEYDGDGRSARDAQGGGAFSCDAVGCIAHVKGATVAVARHPAAVADDCLNADILILDDPKPADCAVPGTVIDVFDRWRNGAYALYLARDEASPEPRVRLETVAAHRGERPWSVLPQRRSSNAAGAADPPATLPKPRILDAAGTGAAKRGDPSTPSADNAPAEPRALHDDDPGELAGMDDGQDAQ